MAYEKRMCVMKQLKKGFSADGDTLSGVVYAERLGDELTVTPRLLGLSPVTEGRYVLVFRAENTTLFLEYGGSPIKARCVSSLKNGFSVLLCFVRGEAEGVAFGGCGDIVSPEILLSSLSEGGKKEEKYPEEQARGKEPPFRELGYDDEAIARDNYFAPHVDEDGDGEGEDLAKKGEIAGGGDPLEDEMDGDPRGSLAYYFEIKEKLDLAREKFPPDERLKAVFPQSEWFQADAALLGIIYEEGKPRYLCVAVERTGDPPADMEGMCRFVPLPYEGDKGFWVVFQDADTGDTVTVSDE